MVESGLVAHHKTRQASPKRDQPSHPNEVGFPLNFCLNHPQQGYPPKKGRRKASYMWQGAVGFLQETSRQCVYVHVVFSGILPRTRRTHTHKSTAFEVPGQTSWPRTGGRPRKSNWRPNSSGALCFPLKPSLFKFMCVGGDNAFL